MVPLDSYEDRLSVVEQSSGVVVVAEVAEVLEVDVDFKAGVAEVG